MNEWRIEYDYDTELIENILMSMKRGKAADLYGLSVEHLQYSHQIMCSSQIV